MRMLKFQPLCVQQLSVQLKALIFVTVSLVADNGMTEKFCVHPYLMSSARLELKFRQGVLFKSFENSVKRDGSFFRRAPAP